MSDSTHYLASIVEVVERSFTFSDVVVFQVYSRY